MLRYLLPAALALSSGVASAELVTVRYDFPEIANYAFTWGYFGGERGPTTGHIVGTTLHITYTTTGDQDAADFYFTFDVPTLDGAQTHIGLTGADLGWSGQGEFNYSFDDSELYNGEIRTGRFGAEFAGGGAFADSYIEFLVDADPVDPVFADGFDPL
ncbi:MAG TPA: hypothetical protein VKB52_09595 [Rhodanobacteraceae bacterium]|nr:hypothetical protein [Rhodanobacteraceae bacterium]